MKNVLIENLWAIFECAKEECNDGDNFNPDMTVAPNLFVKGIEGNPEYQYKALAHVDVANARKKWKALDAYGQSNAYNEVDKVIDDNYKALCAAYVEGDKAKFEAIVNGSV